LTWIEKRYTFVVDAEFNGQATAARPQANCGIPVSPVSLKSVATWRWPVWTLENKTGRWKIKIVKRVGFGA
jgi:hypothetical protein